MIDHHSPPTSSAEPKVNMSKSLNPSGNVYEAIVQDPLTADRCVTVPDFIYECIPCERVRFKAPEIPARMF